MGSGWSEPRDPTPARCVFFSLLLSQINFSVCWLPKPAFNSSIHVSFLHVQYNTALHGWVLFWSQQQTCHIDWILLCNTYIHIYQSNRWFTIRRKRDYEYNTAIDNTIWWFLFTTWIYNQIRLFKHVQSTSRQHWIWFRWWWYWLVWR